MVGPQDEWNCTYTFRPGTSKASKGPTAPIPRFICEGIADTSQIILPRHRTDKSRINIRFVVLKLKHT
jgi:hypothetical protein